MRWPWSKKPAPDPEPTDEPCGIELLPGLSVSASEFEYECLRGRVPTLEIITQGLMEVGQKELWISIAKSSERALEDVVGPTLEFIRVVHEMAKEGRTVDVGGVSSLSPEGSPLLAGSDFHAALYTYPIGMGTDEHAIQTGLSVIYLTLEELEIAQEYGHTRFLSALGQYYRYFPTPPWADPDRPRILSRDTLKESLVAKTMRVGMYRSSSIVESDESDRRLIGHTGHLPDHKASWAPSRAQLSIHPDDKPLLLAALDESGGRTPITMLTSIKPGIGRSMVWAGRDDQIQVISDMHVHGTAIGCNFTMFASEQDEIGSRAFEDGNAVQLTQAAWKDLATAVRADSPFSLAGEGELADFDLVWKE